MAEALDRNWFIFYSTKVMCQKQKLIMYVFTREAGNYCRDGFLFLFS